MPNRPKRSLDPATTREAFDCIIADTDLPPASRELAYQMWDTAIVEGGPRKEPVALRTAFGVPTFRWRWYEECFDWIAREIEPTFGWPYMWTREVDHDGKPSRSPTYDLLSHTLAMKASRIRDRLAYARLRRPHTIWLKGAGCPAEQEIARRYADSFSAGEPTVWPPFFPGDRCITVCDVAQRGRMGAGAIARLDVPPE